MCHQGQAGANSAASELPVAVIWSGGGRATRTPNWPPQDSLPESGAHRPAKRGAASAQLAGDPAVVAAAGRPAPPASLHGPLVLHVLAPPAPSQLQSQARARPAHRHRPRGAGCCSSHVQGLLAAAATQGCAPTTLGLGGLWSAAWPVRSEPKEWPGQEEPPRSLARLSPGKARAWEGGDADRRAPATRNGARISPCGVCLVCFTFFNVVVKTYLT